MRVLLAKLAWGPNRLGLSEVWSVEEKKWLPLCSRLPPLSQAPGEVGKRNSGMCSGLRAHGVRWLVRQSFSEVFRLLCATRAEGGYQRLRDGVRGVPACVLSERRRLVGLFRGARV